MMRLNSCSFDLELVTGRTVIVPLVWVRCGIMGERGSVCRSDESVPPLNAEVANIDAM